MQKLKILVGISGGVDSAVAAYILKNAGHEVIGATMSVWNENIGADIPESARGCFSRHAADDIEEAAKICKILDIPHHVFDCSKQYQKIVLENFKREYLDGRTPNPCVLCNLRIKFEALPNAAVEQGLEFDKFATGHYARLVQNGRYQLKTAVDDAKDQTYFLYRLSQKQLSKVLFPLGAYKKSEIRTIAKQAGLPVHEKKDSQDFYSGDVNDILQTQPRTGNFINKDGKILGTHNGIWNFTIGQRKGLGIAAEKPLYVLGFNKDENEVIVGFDDETAKHALYADNLNWLSIEPITEPVEALVKVRSAQKAAKANIIPKNSGVKVEFFEPQKAIAPGQSVVFYNNDLLLGGGIITKSE